MSEGDKDIPSPFVWDDSFVIGDPVIDAQHRRIFALVAAFESNPNQTTYNDVLNELNLHFAQEDKDLRLTVGPDKSAEHINGHIKSLQMFATKQPGESTVTAIKRWLVHHIKSEDMKFMKSGFKSADEEHLLDIDSPSIQNIQREEEEDEPWWKDCNEIKLIIMIFLSMTFMCVEMAVGFYANSLALISDAFHMIADGISYIVAFVAILWSKKAKGKSYTFGWERSEIIGAFINGILLLSICLFITLESIQRFIELPEVTQPLLVVYVASGGVVLNLIGMVMFGEIEFCCCNGNDEEENPDLVQSPSPEKVSNDNLRAVFVHIIGDLVGQLCAITSGLLIHFLTEHWRFYFDPSLSLIIVFLLAKHSIPIVKRSMQVFMQRTPKYIKMEALQTELTKVPDIVSMHELHVWSLSGETTIASLHLTLLRGANFPKILFQIKTIFHSFGVHSITVQPEYVSAGALQSKHPQCILSCDNRACNLRPCCPPMVDPPVEAAVLQRHLHEQKALPDDEVIHSHSESDGSLSSGSGSGSAKDKEREVERGGNRGKHSPKPKSKGKEKTSGDKKGKGTTTINVADMLDTQKGLINKSKGGEQPSPPRHEEHTTVEDDSTQLEDDSRNM